MPQRLHRVHLRGAQGGVDAEDDANDPRNGEGDHGRPEGDDGFHAGKVAHEPGNGHAEQHADHAARAGEHHGLNEELRDDVAAFGAERAADADLAGALGHAGEHDVHDADAADDQRDGRNRAEHDVEYLLGALGAFEQLERHDDVVVLLLVVALHHFFDGVGDGDDLFRRGNFDGDFVELDPFLFKTAAAHLPQDFAVTGLGRFQRDEHPLSGGLDVVSGFRGARSFPDRFHDADDFVVIAANADILAERWFERKKALYHSRAQDTDVGLVLHFLVREKAPTGDVVIAHLRIPGDGAHDFGVRPPADVPDVFAHDAARDDDGDAGDGGPDALDVEVGQAVLQHVALAAFLRNFLFLRRFDAAENDVLAAEGFDLFLGCVTRAFANREHRDDGADAKHDAQRGEERAQFVEPKALDAQAHGPPESEQPWPAHHANRRE